MLHRWSERRPLYDYLSIYVSGCGACVPLGAHEAKGAGAAEAEQIGSGCMTATDGGDRVTERVM